MADSLVSIDKKCIFRDEFSSEQNTRRLGGTPINVTFANGSATFNSSSDTIVYNKFLPTGTYSFHLKIALGETIAGNAIIFSTTDYGAFLQQTNLTYDLVSYYGTNYVNGIVNSSVVANTMCDVIITGVALTKSRDIKLCGIGTSNNYFVGNVELFEIYQGTLTANEVKNLYENKRYREVNDTASHKCILDVSAQDGTVRNKYSGDTINGNLVPSVILTSVEVVKDNDVYAMKFNGTSSKIDCGSYDGLVGNKTFVVWSKKKGKYATTGSWAALLNNGKLNAYQSGADIYYLHSGTTQAVSDTSFKKEQWQCYIATRTSTGITNIYINGVLSGTANQAAGVPIAGTSNLFIGYYSGQVYEGKIASVRIYDGLMTVQEISSIYSSEKSKYGL